MAVGAKVIGIWIVWPADSVAGSAGDGVPTVNCGEFDFRLEIVSAVFAVSVSVCSDALPIVVVGNAVAGPVSTGVTGEPKPSTCPSRVPT